MYDINKYVTVKMLLSCRVNITEKFLLLAAFEKKIRLNCNMKDRWSAAK